MEIQLIRQNKKILLKSGDREVKAKGIHIFEFAKVESDQARVLQAVLDNFQIQRKRLFLEYQGNPPEKLLNDLHAAYSYYKALFLKKFKTREIVKENMTTTVGRSVLCQRLAGINTYSANVNYTALGTDATAPTVSQTQLVAETYRKALSSGTFLNNIAYLETFFTASEVSGAFNEFANFIDGTGSANTGQMFNRFTQAVIKSLVETLNVSSQITINDN